MNPTQFVNLMGNLKNGGVPSMDKFANVFSNIGGGVDGLATMITNAQNSIQNDISGQISKINREIKNLAVANATYITNKAIGKDVTGMPSAESIVTNINTRIQTELKEIMEKASKAIMGKLAVPAPVSGPNYVGGFKTGKTGKTLKKVSVLHRTKTHRRSAVVSKV